MRPLLPLAVSLLALAACTATRQPDPAAVLAQPLPATMQQQAAEQLLLSTGKIRVAPGGVLVLQLGTGNTASPALTDNTRAGQRQGAAASAPGSTAGNSSRRAGGGVSPWWFVAMAVGAVVLWGLVKPKFAAWWARLG